MEAKFKIGDILKIVDGPDESKIGKEVVVVNSFNFVRKTKVSAINMWEYKVNDGMESLGWISEYYLEQN